MDDGKKWWLIGIAGRREGPLRVKVAGPNAALRYGEAWIDEQARGNDIGLDVAYTMTMVYLDRDQQDVVVGMSSR